MDRFLAMKERGETILFSELLAEIPSDDVLRVLFPPQKRTWKQLATKRGMEVLKLHLNGFRQPEIAKKLDLTSNQVAYASAMIKNSLYKSIPPYIDVDIPSLRKILGLEPKKRVGYTKLSELLQGMPSDDELLALFIERGNIVRPGGKPPPTSKDLQLLEMRRQGQSYDNIGEETGMDTKEVQRQISLTLKRILRDLRIDLDVPALHEPIEIHSKEQTPVCKKAEEKKQDLTVAKAPEGFLCQRWDKQIFVDESGIIKVRELEFQLSSDYEPLMDMFYSAGYKFVVDNAAFDLALSFEGQNIVDFEAELRRRAVKSAAARERRNEGRKKWADHVEDMSNMVIGIESIDLFETGFHIWLLLNTQHTYQQQRDYVRERHEAIMLFVNHELQNARRRVWQKAARLMPFANLVSVTITRQNTVQYTYELKNRIQEILKMDTDEDGG